MKSIFVKYCLAFTVASVLLACDSDFGEYNISPVTLPAPVDPSLLFSGAQLNAATWYNQQLTGYSHAVMQYGWSDNWPGTNYTLSLSNYAFSPWNNYYSTVLKNLEYAISQMEGKSDYTNTLAAAKVWRVFVYQKLTDIYGDIPYTEAAKAFEDDASLTPTYDTQQSIYTKFVTELRAARDAFDPSAAKGVQGDNFYGGDVAKWKRLANSLLLRVGMRMVRVDSDQAETLVQEAVNPTNGGVMTGNADQPVLNYSSTVQNGLYESLGDQHFLLHNTLVDYLIDTSDPRLNTYGALYRTQKTNNTVSGATDAALSSRSFNFITPFTSTNTDSVTRIRWDVFYKRELPFYHFPYNQVELLLAEAVLRDYITGDASEHYAKAVTAHMTIMSDLGGGTIGATAISDYLTLNPLTGTTDDQIEQVNTEFWVSGFLFQADEAWINWRRTGYPDADVLAVNPNASGNAPRKMPYPTEELTYNTDEVNKALARYGNLNDFNALARVWWDPQ